MTTEKVNTSYKELDKTLGCNCVSKLCKDLEKKGYKNPKIMQAVIHPAPENIGHALVIPFEHDTKETLGKSKVLNNRVSYYVNYCPFCGKKNKGVIKW